MEYNQILAIQKEYGYTELQKSIDNGQCWMMEGSRGRAAMYALENGMCMLPTKSHRDYYGNVVPSRDLIKEGSKGSYKNCSDFWEGVEDGSIFLEKECTEE